MYISAETLDDLLRSVIPKLLKSRTRISPSRGAARELTGVLLNIRNPRARLSRTETRGRLFSCLGELLWYLSGTNTLRFITHYISEYRNESDDQKTVYGGYGPRLLKMGGEFNQLKNVRTLLKNNLDSRRAVIQLFGAADIAVHHKEVPCTCTLQFLARGGRLHMFTHMRSNDAFIGLPHDVFAFTMIQELMARSLGLEMGTYKHAVGSLHLYEKDVDKAHAFLDEGVQATVSMPVMPHGDQWPAVRRVLKAEGKLRLSRPLVIEELRLEKYWMDLIRLLQIHACSKANDSKEIARLKRKMSVRIYDPYIETRRVAAKNRAGVILPVQVELFATHR